MSSSSVDWRNRFGSSWLTQIKNQGNCDSCYVYAAVGVLEAMLRIEHGAWCLLSENDVADAASLFDGAHGKGQGGTPNLVLDWIQTNGVADPGCWMGSDQTAVAMPTPDRSGRIAKLDGYTTLSGSADMKTWLDLNGPITGSFVCYREFSDACKNDEVYIVKNKVPNGSHDIVIVGYDDTKQAWLIRNSWDTVWGTNGYGWFGYGQGSDGLEVSQCCGILGTSTNPSPWSKRRLHNGCIFESGNGQGHRNFEVFVPGPNKSIRHYWRDGGSGNWGVVETLPTVDLGNTSGYDCISFMGALESSYNRNFEVVYPTSFSETLRHTHYSQATGQWISRDLFGPPVSPATSPQFNGRLGFCQTNFGTPGNFEVVASDSNGQLQNWLRDNADNTGVWTRPETGGVFGSNILTSGATLVERWAPNGAPTANFACTLDLVCVTKDKVMQRWERDGPPGSTWAAGETFGANVTTPPVMIRSQYGMTDETTPGNYELCVAVNGQIEHWWLPGSQNGQWTKSATFGTDVSSQSIQQVVGLLQSSYGFNLEVIAELTNGVIQHFFRDGAGWHPGTAFGAIR
jgi:hypothetical protein